MNLLRIAARISAIHKVQDVVSIPDNGPHDKVKVTGLLDGKEYTREMTYDIFDKKIIWVSEPLGSNEITSDDIMQDWTEAIQKIL